MGGVAHQMKHDPSVLEATKKYRHVPVFVLLEAMSAYVGADGGAEKELNTGDGTVRSGRQRRMKRR